MQNDTQLKLEESRSFSGYQNKQKGLNSEPAEAIFSFAWQLSAGFLGCILFNNGEKLDACLVFLLGLIVGLGHSLSICSKIPASKLLYWFLLIAPLAVFFLAKFLDFFRS